MLNNNQSLKSKSWGIDLTGRKMWYDPWLLDNQGKYRNPTDKEKEEIYSISGEAVKETLLYFEKCLAVECSAGSNNAVDKLITLLNDHVINNNFKITRGELLDETRWYNNEYYFYFIMFTKKVIGRYDFHYGEGKDEQLSVYHKIYEKGFMEFVPFPKRLSDGKIIGPNNKLITNLIKIIENGNTFIKNITDAKKELFDWIRLSLLNKQIHFDINILKNEFTFIDTEMGGYFFEFFKILSGDENILEKMADLNINNSIINLAIGLPVIKVFQFYSFLVGVYDNTADYKLVRSEKNTAIIKRTPVKEFCNSVGIYFLSYIKNSCKIVVSTSRAFIKKNLKNIIINDIIEQHHSINKNDYCEYKYKWTKKVITNFKNISINLILIIIIIFIYLIINKYFFIINKFAFISLLVGYIFIVYNIYIRNYIIKLNNIIESQRNKSHKDYTDLENINNDLIKEKQSLEQKVIDRTKQLEEANRQKTNFFVNLTHEIKTPLTLISNYLDKHIKKSGSTEEIKIIEQNLNKLKNDIINFMDAEKLESGQTLFNHNQIINLSEILKLKAMMFRETANKKNIDIKTKIDNNIFIKIDPSAIDRIINNLLDNAIKYTQDNGKINISLLKNNDLVEMIISDTGIGISEEEQKNIFEPYYQIFHEKRNIQGIGMGLHIVKKILDEINTGITLISGLNNGSSFKITFKSYKITEGDKVREDFTYSKPADTISTIKIDNPEYDEQKQTILLVEDNIDMLSYLQNNISDHYNVFCSINGLEALQKLENIPKPDLIITDIMMDIMDGLTFFEELKNNEIYNDIPVIFLTAKTSNSEKLNTLLKGAIDYIYKPFAIDILMAKINSVLNLKKVQKESNIKEIEKKLSKIIRTEFNENKNNKYFDQYVKYNITKKEQDTLLLLFDGLEAKEIEQKLDIPLNTLKKRLTNIYKKCGVQNKMELFKLFHK